MKVRCFSWDSLKLSFIHKCTFLWFAIGYISKAQAIWISRSCEILWKKYRFSWTGQYFTKVQHSGLIMCTMLLLLDTVSNDVWLWHILEYVFCPHWVKWNYGCICISINLCIAFMLSSKSNFLFSNKKDRKRWKKNLFIIHATKVEGSFEFFVVMINYFFHYYGPVWWILKFEVWSCKLVISDSCFCVVYFF